MTQINTHGLTELGYKILLDRYALKDMTRSSIKEGDIVIAILKSDGSDISQKREIATVIETDGKIAKIELYPSGEIKEIALTLLDKPLETAPEEIQRRVAKGVASVEETEDKKREWQDNFDWLLDDWKFVPGGRILNAAGTDQKLSYFNCYMVGEIPDSRGGIISRLGDMAEIMSRGGGAGINISSIRPRNAYVAGVNGRSSGAVSWGALFSFVTGLISQAGSRRGALLILLPDWHPDLLEFIHSKRESGKIENANISVGLSDTFMESVKIDGDWNFYFPDTSHPKYNDLWKGDIDEWRALTGVEDKPSVIQYGMPVPNVEDWDGVSIVPHGFPVPARYIWNIIIESAWASAEPGLIFIERFNKLSNSSYYPEGKIIGTNPCSEIGLPAWGNCNLGAINYSKFWDEKKQDVKWDVLKKTVQYAVRFLDNVIDATHNFDDRITQQQFLERRIGLGAMGIGELLIKAKIRYGSDESVNFLDKIFGFVAVHAYEESARIGKEKGSFPAYDKNKYLQSGYFTSSIDQWANEYIRDAVNANSGIRNVVLLTVQPTGTIGTVCATSTGIEPFFSWIYYRQGRLGFHEERVQIVQDWLRQNPDKTINDLPDYFVNAMDLKPDEHVKVQAAVQKWIDQSISKTCNLPEDYTIEQTGDIYMMLYDMGCKGGTVYRQNSRHEQVLSVKANNDDNDYQIDNSEKTHKNEYRVSTVIHLESNDLTLNSIQYASVCPECEEKSLTSQDGCQVCLVCGFSMCSV